MNVSCLRLNTLDISIIGIYFTINILIGWFAKRRSENSAQFLNASRSLPVWVVTLAFLAANCGALELMGMAAMGAQYGLRAAHFYYIGAVPAMIFLSLWMLPAYRNSNAQSVLEFLGKRYNESTRLAAAIALGLAMQLLSGISLYAVARILQVVLGWQFQTGALIAAAVVLTYVYLGGARATIYNEVLQLGIILAGLLPLLFVIFRRVHSISDLLSQIPPEKAHLWSVLPSVSPAAQMDKVGVIFGLGFILSFGYWCTDFVLMQRALAARNVAAATQVPLWAAFGKSFFPLLVILPGVASIVLLPGRFHSNYDQVLPVLMASYLGHGLIGLGVTALLASLSSSLAANVTALSALWTNDIYRSALCSDANESHYIKVGRATTISAVVLSFATSYFALHFSNLMEYIQLLFSLFNAPLFAIFLLGVFCYRVQAKGAFWGFLGGVFVSLMHNAVAGFYGGVYGSRMAMDFYGAIYGFMTTILVALLFLERHPAGVQLHGIGVGALPNNMTEKSRGKLTWVLAILLLAVCIAINVVLY